MVLAISRAVERLIADSMFGVSLILGWNLFRVGILHDQTAEASGKGWKIRLQKVGPGVFFALFGAAGLIVALQRPLDIKMSSEGGSIGYSVSSATGENGDVLEYVKALTTAESLGMRDNGTHSAEKDALLKAKPILEQHRQFILRAYWKDKYDWYMEVKSDPLRRGKLNATEEGIFQKIDRSVNDTFATNAE
jgi:hypothetical protein